MIKKLLKYLLSIHFFIATLTLLGIVSIIGIIIPQGWDHPQYLQKFGKAFACFIIRAHWHHIFNSAWFIIPLAAFTVNLIFCVYTRIISLMTTFKKRLTDNLLSQQHEQAVTLEYADTTLEHIQNQLERSLAKNHYVFTHRDTADGAGIIAQKGRIGLAGSMILHAGLVILIAGGILQSYWGDSAQVLLSEGRTVPVEKFDFKLRMQNFKRVVNKKGELLNYATAFKILDNNGTILLNDTTKVNAPVTYRDFYFYQMNYGYDPSAVKELHCILIDTVTGDTIFNQTVPFRSQTEVGKDSLYIRCDAFLCDFVFDINTRKPLNRSHEHRNPAFRIALSMNDSLIHSQWVFLNFPLPHGSHGRYNCKITSYNPAFYSGIEIRKKPGTIIIWLGIILVSTGLIFVFSFPFRQIVLFCKESDGAVQVIIIPDKKKSPDWFKEETDKIRTHLEAGV